MPNQISPPTPDEYATFYSPYIALVPDKALEVLERDMDETLTLLRSLPEDKGSFRYAPEKWSVKDVVNHIIDAERIFCYRALRIGRGDKTELNSFSENDYVANAGANRRTFAELCAEFEHVRKGTLDLFRSFDEKMLTNWGTANKFSVTVRALAYIVAGHARHHLGILRERYGL